MRILAIGDFHGKFSEKLIKKIKKENFDVIFSNGDYCGQKGISEIDFKYYYGKNSDERKKVPKHIQNKLRFLENKSVDNGSSILKKIKNLKKPFFGVRGNWDPTPWSNDVGAWTKSTKQQVKKLNHVLEKDFEFVDFRFKDFDNFVLVGGTSSSYPGMLRKNMIRRIMEKWDMSKEEAERYVNGIKRDTKWRTKKFEMAFSKAKKLKKPIIFLTHNSPYGTKLDVIKSKKAHKLAKGQHYGSYLDMIMIKKFKPELVLCGHIHENFGKDKLGRSLIVNVGSAQEENFVIIDFNEKTRKFKIKFVGKK